MAYATIAEKDDVTGRADAASAAALSGKGPDEANRKKAREVDDKFSHGLAVRRPHEGQWFVNGAFYRGYQYVEWNGRDYRLTTPPAPRNRIRLTINRIQPKIKARLAKFLKNRPTLTVIPATTDIDDKLDARATSKLLEYSWKKLELERKYSTALRWCSISGHGLWWFYWDESATGKMLQPTAAGGSQVVTAQIGDICIEAGSPFELVVADATLDYIGDQPWIVRAKRRPMSYVEERYKEMAPFVKPDALGQDDDSADNSGERYARQLGNLNSQQSGGAAFVTSRGVGYDTTGTNADREKWVLVKEYYEKPCGKYPQGRMVVTAGGVTLRSVDSLPYFSDFKQNPYPCVDFLDFPQAGQYWGTTVIEQLIQPQREYNLIRSKLAEHLRMMVHPKLIVFKQHNLQPGVWTQDAGEVITAGWAPGLPLPTPWNPPPISSNAWQAFDLLKGEIEDITQIFPETEGKVAGSTSGFQTNLIQEATDAVHAPDIRAHELVILEAGYKIRRLYKLFMSPARLITIAGHDLTPDSFEFHRDDIDENADIEIQVTSALPQLKAARMQAIMEMWTAGLLGEPNDPRARARTLSLMEMGSTEDIHDSARKNEERARNENLAFQKGEPVQPPQFYENHDAQFRVHTDDLISRTNGGAQIQELLPQVEHVLRHIAFVNPAAAFKYAQEYGLQELAMQLMPQVVPPAAGPAAPPAAAGPAGAPPPGAPPAGGSPPPAGPPAGGM